MEESEENCCLIPECKKNEQQISSYNNMNPNLSIANKYLLENIGPKIKPVELMRNSS